ncbi:hypothetical protein [Chitinophaga pinensis]|uniref:Uncharacterized protein n=1 Tax=Chitinophaga pinensis (strain ATCC 43595 / DSM 2588 / LMG 13176 / NBRC 15968 / NCIMB 11800 / UQM 2034) TaxID=485918 RepID=A0A979GU93_CHIPD|nr:hypothetical protein [Chitinophaga pinensis]ACU60634.1 hypothetical protein Cpin_3167 [Chitinophaga pinensis DSM 2588]
MKKLSFIAIALVLGASAAIANYYIIPGSSQHQSTKPANCTLEDGTLCATEFTDAGVQVREWFRL